MPAPDARVVVYSATERRYCAGLLARFATLHPGVEVELRDGISTALHRRYLERFAAGCPEADVMWSSAMDLQMELVLAGHAARYRSAHAGALPSWAVYRDSAYATTLEPLVTLLDGHAGAALDAPAGSVGELAALLAREADRLHGRVACLDVESNGLGFLALLEESRDERGFAAFLDALSACGPIICDSQRSLLDAVQGGKAFVALHVLGAYASRAVAADASLRIARTESRVPGVSRIAFVCANAPHGEEARMFLDFLLAAAGQRALQEAGLFALGEAGGESRWQPIPIDGGMTDLLDTQRRQRVLAAWRDAVGRTGTSR
jgi:iron(III) transport system substrate-binding protein